MVIVKVLDIRPVGYVEVLVDSVSPLFCLQTDAAFILLSSEVVSVESVAARSLQDKLLRPDCFSIETSAYHTTAVSELTLLVVLLFLLF